MRQPLNRFGPSRVVAPFAYQPTRQGLRGGFGSLGATSYAPPVGAGAGKGAETGAQQGLAIGSTFGPIGSAVGAVIGAVGGAIAGSINKKDPEQYNFDSAVALWQANRTAVLNIGDKYLVLAGLFDLNLKNPHIPIYQKYGHMGEQKFVTDMVNVIYQAALNGQITAADTPQTIMTRIVQPWIDSWGFGPMVDPHADMINLIILGMIAEYVAGQQGNWLAVSGAAPNWNLPPFPLQAVLGQSNTTSAVNPIGSTTTTAATTAPGYSPNGSVITVSAPGTLVTPAGTFLVSGTTYALNGAAILTSPTTAGLAYVNGQVYRYDADGTAYVYSNGGWVATNQAPSPGAAIAGGIAPTSTINPVGSSTTTATTTQQTPAQLVASPPAAGTTVAYAPDMSQNGTAMGLPSGLLYEGRDPYNGSWILQNSATGQLYVVWQGSLVPYTSSLFAPAAATTSTAQSVTGSGTTGVNTGTTPTTTNQVATTTATPAQSNTGLLLGAALVGALLLARPKRRAH